MTAFAFFQPPTALQAAVLIFLGITNLTAFILMGIDKSKARRHKWRIPEKTLFLFPLLGGGLGGTIGMFVFRHKTRHWYFRFGFPLITLAEIYPLYLLWKIL